MKQLNVDGLLDIRDEPHYFPVLSTWDPAVLTDRLRSMIQAEGREPNYENLRGYAAHLESDLDTN